MNIVLFVVSSIISLSSAVASVLLCSISRVLLLCFEISLYWSLQVQSWSGGTSKWRWTLGSVGHCQHEGDDQIHEWTTRSVVSSCGSSRDCMSIAMIIITSGQSKGGIAAAFGWFSCIHQVVPVCTPSNTWFLGPTSLIVRNGISISSSVFAQLMADSPHTLQWASPFCLKIAPSHGDLHSIYYMPPWPTQAHIANDISVGSAVFAQFTIMTDRQTILLRLQQ